MKTIRDLELYGKKVIIRCDFNVPIENNKVVDDNRIVSCLSTINYVKNKGAKVILLSHLGRIKSEADKEKYTLAPVAKRLEQLLKRDVLFIPKTRGVEKELANLKNGQVALLENTRFEDFPNKLESNNDEELATYWASLGDIFVNDAFGTSHRKHASNVGIANKLPAAAGFLLEKEIQQLQKLENPQRPYTLILGGAKVSDKIYLIENLVKKADYVLVGGGIANTFIKAKGYNVGRSLIDEESVEFCQKLLAKTDKIIIPVDVKVANKASEEASERTVKIDQIGAQEESLDIGMATVRLYCQYIKKSKTIIWNGTVGYAEIRKFARGTREIAMALKRANALTIVAGGDTAAILIQMGFKGEVTHISTGGGAAIEMLEGKELPGISVLSK